MRNKVENININENVDLFEYEMTEVILRLKGEFAAFTGKDTKYAEVAVDEQKLVINLPTISAVRIPEGFVELPKIPQVSSVEENNINAVDEKTITIQLPRTSCIMPVRFLVNTDLDVIEKIKVPLLSDIIKWDNTNNKKDSGNEGYSQQKYIEIPSIDTLQYNEIKIKPYDINPKVVKIPQVSIEKTVVDSYRKDSRSTMVFQPLDSPTIPIGINSITLPEIKSDISFYSSYLCTNIPSLIFIRMITDVKNTSDNIRNGVNIPVLRKWKSVQLPSFMELEVRNTISIPYTKHEIKDIATISMCQDIVDVPVVPEMTFNNSYELNTSRIKISMPIKAKVRTITYDKSVAVDNKPMVIPNVEKIGTISVNNVALVGGSIEMPIIPQINKHVLSVEGIKESNMDVNIPGVMSIRKKWLAKELIVRDSKIVLPAICDFSTSFRSIEGGVVSKCKICIPDTTYSIKNRISEVKIMKKNITEENSEFQIGFVSGLHIPKEFVFSVSSIDYYASLKQTPLSMRIIKPIWSKFEVVKEESTLHVTPIIIPKTMPTGMLKKVVVKTMHKNTITAPPQVDDIVKNIISLANAEL